jgi:hypothetical protein
MASSIALNSFSRIDPLPALRNPLHLQVLAATGWAATGETGLRGPGEHGLLHPRGPDRAAQLMHDHAVLEGISQRRRNSSSPARMDE